MTMKISLKSIEDSVHNCVAAAESGSAFPVSKLAGAVCAKLKVPEDDSEARTRVEHQCEMFLASSMDFFLYESKHIPYGISRKTFFNGCEFRVVPSKFELTHGILFPGARFQPFCTTEIFPDEYQIIPAGANQPCAARMELYRYADFASAYFLLGRDGLIDYLVAESDDNYKFLRSHAHMEQAEFMLTVFDLRDFYAKNDVTEGDALVFTVSDWANACFTFRKLDRDHAVSQEKQIQWIATFESALLRVCARNSNYQEISQQLAEGYLYAFEAGEDLRHKPFVAMDEYQNRMSEIAIRRDDSEWALVPADDLRTPGADPEFHDSGEADAAEDDAHEHHGAACSCGHDHHDGKTDLKALNDDIRTHTDDGEEIVKHLSSDNFSASQGALDSVEAILAELNSPLDYIEIYAMIQDAMANGEEEFSSFSSRLMDILGIAFTDDAQEAAFLNFMEDSWESCQEFYSPTADASKIPLRSRLLDLSYQKVDLAKGLLEHYGKNVPEEIARELKMVHRQILDTLSLMNSESELPEGDDYEQLELRVGDIEDAWDILLEHTDSKNV